MVVIRRASGKVEQKGESIGEFRQRLKRQRIKRRGKTSSEILAEKKAKEKFERERKRLEREVAEAEPVKVVTATGDTIFRTFIPRTGTVFESRDAGTRLSVQTIRGKQKIVGVGDITRTIRVSDTGKEIRDIGIQKKKPVSIKPKDVRVFGETFLDVKKKDVVPLPRRFAGQEREVTVVKQIKSPESFVRRLRKISPALSKRAERLQEKGKLSAEQRKAFEKQAALASKKKEKAILKINAIFADIDKKNDNFNKVFDRVSNVILPREELLRKRGLSTSQSKQFLREVTSKTGNKLSKYLNPIIVGFEIGGVAEAFRTAKEADIVSIPRATQKAAKGVGVIGKEILTLDTAKLSTRVRSAERFIKTNAPKAVELAKTPEGLSTILTIAILTKIPQKAITKGVKFSVEKGKVIGKVDKSFLAKLQLESNKLLRSKKGGLRLGKGKKVRLTKAELRKGERSTRKFLSKAQKKESRRQTAKELQRFQFQKEIERRGVVFRKPIQISTKPTTKGKPNQLDQFVSVDTGKGTKALVKKPLKVPKKKTETTQKLVSKPKVPTIKQINQRVLAQTKDKVIKDLRPETLFPQLIVPQTTKVKGGFRKGVKEKLLNKLLSLKAQREKELSQIAKLEAQKITRSLAAKKAFKTKLEREKLEARLLRQFLNKRISKSDVRSAIRLSISSRVALNLDNSLRALSAVRLKFDVVSKVATKVRSISIIKTEQEQELRKRLITVTPTAPKKPSKPSVKAKSPRKPSVKPLKVPKKVPVPKPVLPKSVKPKILRFPREPIKKVKLPKIPFIKFPSKPSKTKIKVSKPKDQITFFTPTLVGKLTKRRKKDEELKFFSGLEVRP